MLVALSEPDLIVWQISANAADMFDDSPDEMRGGSLRRLLGPRQFELFRAYVNAGGDLLTANPLRLLAGYRGVEVNCTAHRQDDVLIAEFEPLSGAHLLEPLNFAAHIGLPLARMEQAPDLAAVACVAADEMRRISGFERVMVYRFDAAWNGEVIAESGGSAGVSYLGLHFPATDIPAQARRLFLLNPLRAIADVWSAPVPLLPQINPRTNRPLDLTRSSLRSSSPVHIQYLKNMEVRASLTVSIVVGEQLWGMIACHDGAPRPIGPLMRSVCELIGRILASQVALRNANLALQERLRSYQLLERYMAGVEASTSLFAAAPFHPAPLMELLDADGLVSSIDGVFSTTGTGDAVDQASLQPVIGKLRQFASRGIASSNMLGVLDPSAAGFAGAASGALYLGLSEGTQEYLLVLRRELVETVSWAGNPNKAVNADADGTLRPRTSFAAWQETLRGRARPWSDLQLQSARYLREQLLRLRDLRRSSASADAARV